MLPSSELTNANSRVTPVTLEAMQTLYGSVLNVMKLTILTIFAATLCGPIRAEETSTPTETTNIVARLAQFEALIVQREELKQHLPEKHPRSRALQEEIEGTREHIILMQDGLLARLREELRAKDAKDAAIQELMKRVAEQGQRSSGE
jgi:hypothetical protein